MTKEKDYMIIGKAEIQVCFTAKNQEEARKKFNSMTDSEVLETMKDSECAFVVDFDEYNLEEI